MGSQSKYTQGRKRRKEKYIYIHAIVCVVAEIIPELRGGGMLARIQVLASNKKQLTAPYYLQATR